ncbi:MAG: amidophosphoribosyltransferase [Candidatus Puniceispirillum sp. TMED52]|nr:amidophosphoribosyltransferase [SAR116 cluster bacterium]OUU45354.1 MAG: amidophosphoribosyltransferase [Candidatus Puniceispirillum sp. TMED52]|tara:strand:- start:35 stop:1477 length:1443 start_codon:yes stop_codon:yes gene_type:complete
MPHDGKLPFDSFQEECAVFGVYGSDEAAVHTALGLHALQHRGQEATGIISFDGDKYHSHRGFGHVGENFDAASGHLDKLVGYSAIGHNRYSTTGEPELRNIQPFFSELAFGGFALAHNGNLTNADRLRQSLVETGSLMQSTTDTEVIIHLVARSHQTDPALRLVDAMKQVEGAYSLVSLSPQGLIAMRDPHGVRPLVLGQIGDAYVVASETCGLDIIGADFIRDVKPGEMIIINEDGMTSSQPLAPQPSRFCVFEYIYFARPDSVMENQHVYGARKHIGHELARESHIDADVIVPVPDSGIPAALGYAEETHIPFDFGIIRNHYVGRTFIQPTDAGRQTGVKMKHNANSLSVSGKRVVIVDDSIVRGTTSIKIVNMIRDAGATEVHMRIASPPTTHPCFYGVDTPDRDKLIAASMDTTAIAKHIGVDSLAFISIDGLYRALDETGRDPNAPQYCDACFTGDYPIEPRRSDGKSTKGIVSK